MSKRLQVLLEEEEYAEIQRIAGENHMTMAEWVRDALRRAKRAHPHTRTEQKLRALERATNYEFPTADIDQMLGEIERGYGSGLH
jgi:hypothetical protein